MLQRIYKAHRSKGLAAMQPGYKYMDSHVNALYIVAYSVHVLLASLHSLLSPLNVCYVFNLKERMF